MSGLTVFPLHHFKSRWERTPAVHRGTVAIAIPMLCLLLTLAAWYGSLRSTTKADQEVQRTEEMLLAKERLLVDLLNAETGIRGYVASDRALFLEPYLENYQAIPQRLEQLEALVPESVQTQRDRLAQVEQEVDRQLALLEQLREAPATELNPLLLEGKRNMDRIRHQLDQVDETARRQLNGQRQRLAEARARAAGLFSLMVPVSLVSCAAVLLMLRDLERNLNRAHLQVGEQTYAVAQLNRKLDQSNVTLGQRNEELDRFAYVTAHDLKAPLRAIANLSEWIEEDAAEALPPSSRKQFKLLRGRVYRLEGLLNALLEYAGVGRRQVKISKVEVRSLLEHIMADLRESLDLKTVSPEFVLSPDLPRLYTSQQRLRTVFEHLLRNGVIHSDRPDPKIRVEVQDQGQQYRFSVTDNGPGIDAVFHDKVFVIFQTLQPRDRLESTGAGLAIVQKLVQSMGGEVGLESVLGRGSTFYFTWPKQM